MRLKKKTIISIFGCIFLTALGVVTIYLSTHIQQSLDNFYNEPLGI